MTEQQVIPPGGLAGGAPMTGGAPVTGTPSAGPPPGGLAGGVPVTGLVWRLSMRWRSAIDRAITPLGLTNAQYSLLAPLLGMQQRGRRPSQRQLADDTGLEPLYVSKLARGLEQAGLIERAVHPDDSRAVQLTLTDRGREVTTQATDRVRGLQDELTAPLGGLDSPATQALIGSLRILLGSDPPPSQTGADR